MGVQRTCWAKRDDGLIWNFSNSMNQCAELGCFMTALTGFGYEKKLTVVSVGNDFVTTNREPQQIDIKGTMYFLNADHYKQFDKLFNGQIFKLYYDGSGSIDPQDQLSCAWYKEVEITEMDMEEQATTGWYVSSVVMTPISATAKRDIVTATTLHGVQSSAHTYSYYYPYFYSSGTQLIAEINNDGIDTGVVIAIKNTGNVALDKVFYYVDSDNNVRQYANWLYDTVKLEGGRTLTIDSRPRTQSAIVNTDDGQTSNVLEYQHPNPQYKNFVDILAGANKFVFDFGRTEDVEITIEIQEESGVL